jgi:hypothetical protein
MYRSLKIVLACCVLYPVICDSVQAQRPFERLQRDLQGWRPDGRILRNIFGESDAEDDEDESGSTDPRRSGDYRRIGQPTPARPPVNQSSIRVTGPAAGDDRTSHPERLAIQFRETDNAEGLLVQDVDRSGAAWAAGIRAGDLITAVGGLKTSSKSGIESIVRVMEPGDQVEFEYVRRGKKQTALVQLGRPRETELAAAAKSLAPSTPGGDLVGPRDDQRGPRFSRSAGDYRQSGQSGLSAGDGLTSVVDPGLQDTGTSRRNTETNRPSQDRWLVTPPGHQRNSAATAASPAVRAEIQQLRQELDRKQREVEQLQIRLRRALKDSQSGAAANQDSLLDFGK